MRKILLFMLCLCLHSMARGQTATYTYRYWFDNQDSLATQGQSTSSSWQMDVDVAGLTDQLHTFHLQLSDEAGEWSSVVNRFFIKLAQASALSGYYWFDDTDSRTAIPAHTPTFDIDVSALSEGLHTLHYMASGTGNTSSTTSRLFVKMPQTASGENAVCQLYVDGNLICSQQLANATGIAAWTQDVNELAEGLHSYMLQVVTTSGTVSTIQTGYFLRAMKTTEQMLCYSIDQGAPVFNIGTKTDGVYYFDFDVSAYPKGLHNITCWLVSDQGTLIYLKTTYFINGRVTVDEITQLIAAYLGTDTALIYVTDIDEDGQFTVSDITELINIYLDEGY
mgnify:CR=1 FL=1